MLSVVVSNTRLILKCIMCSMVGVLALAARAPGATPTPYWDARNVNPSVQSPAEPPRTTPVAPNSASIAMLSYPAQVLHGKPHFVSLHAKVGGAA